MELEIKFEGGLDGHFTEYKSLSPPETSHHHSALEFNLVMRGYGEYILDDKRYQLPPYSIVWLFPKQEHILTNISPDLILTVAVFDRKRVLPLCNDGTYKALRRLKPAGHFCRQLSVAQAHHLNNLMHELNKQKESCSTYNHGVAYLLLSAWDFFQSSQSAHTEFRTLDTPIIKAIKMLQKEDPPDSLEELASHCGISSGLLSKMFKKQLGTSLPNFRNRLRLKRFLNLSKQHDRIDMLHLALEAGFGSYAQFHRVFTESMQCSPAEWKQSR